MVVHQVGALLFASLGASLFLGQMSGCVVTSDLGGSRTAPHSPGVSVANVNVLQ